MRLIRPLVPSHAGVNTLTVTQRPYEPGRRVKPPLHAPRRIEECTPHRVRVSAQPDPWPHPPVLNLMGWVGRRAGRGRSVWMVRMPFPIISDEHLRSGRDAISPDVRVRRRQAPQTVGAHRREGCDREGLLSGLPARSERGRGYRVAARARVHVIEE